MMGLSALAFVLVIAICVISHEFGHLVVARSAGVQVHEFSFGMGPLLVGWKRGGMIWSIRAVPVGGFVRGLTHCFVFHVNMKVMRRRAGSVPH